MLGSPRVLFSLADFRFTPPKLVFFLRKPGWTLCLEFYVSSSHILKIIIHFWLASRFHFSGKIPGHGLSVCPTLLASSPPCQQVSGFRCWLLPTFFLYHLPFPRSLCSFCRLHFDLGFLPPSIWNSAFMYIPLRFASLAWSCCTHLISSTLLPTLGFLELSGHRRCPEAPELPHQQVPSHPHSLWFSRQGVEEKFESQELRTWRERIVCVHPL